MDLYIEESEKNKKNADKMYFHFLKQVKQVDPTTAIYKGQVPFVFEKETHGGLKEASEIYARSILNGEYINTNLLSLNDSLAVYKTLLKTTKIICAIGFEIRSSFGKEYTDYNPNTAEINAGKNIYGFGIAYPGISIIDSINYPNVSVLSFQEQIQRCLPTILEPQQ
jgi:hypothetical protein